MRTRSITALAAAVTLALAACGGGDGGGALSEDDFVDELADICGDVSKDLDRIEFPADEDYEAFAKDVLEVYQDALGRLGEISAPESLAKDYEDFIAVLEDQVDEIEQLGKASDGDEALQSFDQMTKLSDEQSEIAQDLDVAECDPNDGEDTATTVAETTPATTPATTAAPIALPTTVRAGRPGDHARATTPATAPPAGPRFEILDLTTRFIAPDGFYLEAGTPTQGTLDLIASMPELNEKLLSIGVAHAEGLLRQQRRRRHLDRHLAHRQHARRLEDARLPRRRRPARVRRRHPRHRLPRSARLAGVGDLHRDRSRRGHLGVHVAAGRAGRPRRRRVPRRQPLIGPAIRADPAG